MHPLALAASILLGLASAYVIALNWSAVYIAMIARRKTGSWIPLLGGVLGLVAMRMAPFDALHRWCWLPLVVDWGSLPGLACTAVLLLAPRFRR